MPLGLNSLALQGFYSLPEQLFGKSIQPAYRFTASFLENPFRKFDEDVGSMPVIMPYHFLNITVPTYNFKFENVYYGVIPRTYATLAYEGFEVNATFEEDEMGTIAYFINWCQKCIIDSNGYYKAPLSNRIGNLAVEVDDRQGMPVVIYIFKNIFYRSSGDVTYDYGTGESIKYQISFGVDTMETWYVKEGLINGAKTKLINSIVK
jgi:hypothetical protein